MQGSFGTMVSEPQVMIKRHTGEQGEIVLSGRKTKAGRGS